MPCGVEWPWQSGLSRFERADACAGRSKCCRKPGQRNARVRKRRLEAASGEVVRDEGARGCGVSARAGSVRVDSVRAKATGARAASDVAAGDCSDRRRDACRRRRGIPASITGAGRGRHGCSAGSTCRGGRSRAGRSADRTAASAERRSCRSVDCCHAASGERAARETCSEAGDESCHPPGRHTRLSALRRPLPTRPGTRNPPHTRPCPKRRRRLPRLRPAAPCPLRVTVTGCLEVSTDGDTFRLNDVEGADAPKSRSWRTGFLKKRPAPVMLIEPPDGQALMTNVGRRVAATGQLTNRELKVNALRVVGSSCN